MFDRSRSYVAGVVLCAIAYAHCLLGQSDTTISYQGELTDRGSAANGSFAMQFSLWDAPAGGSQIGTTQVFGAVMVVDGLFTVGVDFGASSYPGGQQWLEISVEGATLSPRQPITRAPYAIQTRGLYVDGSERIGIGTETPLAPIHAIGSDSAVLVAENTSPTAATTGLSGSAASTAGIGVVGWATSTTGQNNGVVGSTYSNNGVGVRGQALATSGLAHGGWFTTSSDVGNGAVGQALALTGTNYGVVGESRSTGGTGVLGFNAATTGSTRGVHGQTSSTAGRAVFGESRATTGLAHGGWFQTASASGNGVVGQATSLTGTNYGVVGETFSTSGTGVFASSSAASGVTYGVQGHVASPDGYASYFTGGRNFLGGPVGLGGFSSGARLTVLSNTASAGNNTAVFAANGLGGNVSHVHYGLTGDWYIRSAAPAGLVILQDTGGNVAVGASFTQGYRLAVNGEAGKPGGGPWATFSDERLKKDVRALDNALDRLLALRGVQFEYADPSHFSYLPGAQMGLVAQDVERVFPEWVRTMDDGYKAVTARGFEALTIEAMRELRSGQEEEVNSLRAETASLRAENESLRQRIDSIERALAALASQR